MHILVTSPIPSHPQNHGNRSRVFKLCKALQSIGHKIHYLYAGFEGLTQSQEMAMRDTWDHVYVLPYKAKKRHQDGKRHHQIDEWYIPEVSDLAQRIIERWKIGAVLANYVWFSKVLDVIPEAIPRYIDTHDRFADRHAKLIEDGIAPTWFSTTKSEEAKAFKRATRIFAIQEREAEAFKQYSPTPVSVIGHILESHFIEPKSTGFAGRKLKAGFIASDNAINRRTMADFCTSLKGNSDVFKRMDIYIAGAICDCEETTEPNFIKMGFVENQTDFYTDMDLILNPNMGGSGLKIKSIEALAFGKPLVATSDAMIGIKTADRLHQLPDLGSFCQALVEVGQNPGLLEQLREHGKKEFLGYQRAQYLTLQEIFKDGTDPEANAVGGSAE